MERTDFASQLADDAVENGSGGLNSDEGGFQWRLMARGVPVSVLPIPVMPLRVLSQTLGAHTEIGRLRREYFPKFVSTGPNAAKNGAKNGTDRGPKEDISTAGSNHTTRNSAAYAALVALLRERLREVMEVHYNVDAWRSSAPVVSPSW